MSAFGETVKHHKAFGSGVMSAVEKKIKVVYFAITRSPQFKNLNIKKDK